VRIMVNDGGLEAPLTEAPQFDMESFVAPGGKFIYFSGKAPANAASGLWKRMALCRIPSQVLPTPWIRNRMFRLMASWPTLRGRSLQRPALFQRYALPMTTTLLPLKQGRDESPAWKPDGTQIAYVSTDHKIWLMNPKGRAPRTNY